MLCYPSRHNVRCHPLTINLHLLINHERRGSILTTQSHHRWNKLILADLAARYRMLKQAAKGRT
jgi:hypothetical protein